MAYKKTSQKINAKFKGMVNSQSATAIYPGEQFF